MNIECYDNGGASVDRYTIIYFDYPENVGLFMALAADEHPFHPQGFGQHTVAAPGDHLGVRIPFESLPEDVQVLVCRDNQVHVL